VNFKFKVIIPSRYASSRLPGKPLLEVAGKPLIQHVYETAKASKAVRIIIATDDERILKLAETINAEVIMTSSQHNSGTDRLAEVTELLDEDEDTIIVNLQGDEIGMPASLIDQVASALYTNPKKSIATLCEPITNVEDYTNPNVVKVVFDDRNSALYFSRSPIPWTKQNSVPEESYKHIGLYAYRCGFLKRFSTLPVSPLEQNESLEQLRALHNGEKIHVEVACDNAGIGIDTPEDLEKARKTLEAS
jgi:3-deoxy-manno-octulosonate cytidylyltransferase (CMP-KDO synthetase)